MSDQDDFGQEDAGPHVPSQPPWGAPFEKPGAHQDWTASAKLSGTPPMPVQQTWSTAVSSHREIRVGMIVYVLGAIFLVVVLSVVAVLVMVVG